MLLLLLVGCPGFDQPESLRPSGRGDVPVAKRALQSMPVTKERDSFWGKSFRCCGPVIHPCGTEAAGQAIPSAVIHARRPEHTTIDRPKGRPQHAPGFCGDADGSPRRQTGLEFCQHFRSERLRLLPEQNDVDVGLLNVRQPGPSETFSLWHGALLRSSLRPISDGLCPHQRRRLRGPAVVSTPAQS